MRNQYFKAVNNLPWNQLFYLNLEQEVHPFNEPDRFRPLNKAYDGSNTFWATPSPEPDLSDVFWQDVESAFTNKIQYAKYAFMRQNLDDTTSTNNSEIYTTSTNNSEIYTSSTNNPELYTAAQNLALSVLKWQPDPKKILFVSILRAGVPITEWLCTMLPGTVGVALSLFVGVGIDAIALAAIERDFPDRSIIFVDGWTGKGGVARELAKLNKGPLAVLIDPWGWADFAGIKEDIFCPSACFTGLATLGFSRTFVVEKDKIFSALRFSKEFAKPELVKSWKECAPPFPVLSGVDQSEIQKYEIQKYEIQNSELIKSEIIKSEVQKIDAKTNEIKKFEAKTDLRIHSNEVCRALINAAPKNLLFADDKHFAQKHFLLLLKLAEQRGIKSEFNARHLKQLKTRVACIL
ncbi:MAG: hypothetical protein HQK67_04080 [Desulfamplus sp.]|nr:hypothetical protein [Desulfamplus sp.]